MIQLIPQGTSPQGWAAFCSICDKYISEASEDEGLTHKLGLVHQAKYHPEFVS